MKRIQSIVGALVLAACGDVGEDGAGDGSSSSGPTTSGGDPSSESGSDSSGVADAPTYHRDIAPILRERCGACHADGGIAPFPLESYDDAYALGPVIAVVVEERSMPPWHAIETEECTPPLPFLHDARLGDDEIDTILEWVDTGSLEGDPSTATALPPASDLSLPNPSGEFPMPSAFEIDPGDDQFVCYSIDLGLDRDVWITGAQLTPSNRAIVHHALLFTDPMAESAALAGDDGMYECFGGSGVAGSALFGAYIPGALPIEMPPGSGVHLPAGSRTVIQFHFHPSGQGTAVDCSALALRWDDAAPERLAEFHLLGNFNGAPNLLAGESDRGAPEFRIPAGASRHVETMEWTVPQGFVDARLFSIGNHMHYVGVDMKAEIIRANGDSQCMLQTPGWEFGRQRAYFYDGAFEEFPIVSAGDTVRLRCTYDNSLANDDLVDALDQQGLEDPVEVLLGESSLEEMCMAGIGIAR